MAESGNSRKSETGSSARTSPPCPSCSSHRIWKDGVRATRHGDIQRYLCRECGYRFSESSLLEPMLKKIERREVQRSERSEGAQKVHTSFLKRTADIPSKRQICVTKTIGAKNLAKTESRQKQPAGGTKLDPATIQGKIVEHTFWLLREGYKETTVIYQGRLLRTLVKRGAYLFDGDSIKETIANMKISDDTKLQYAAAYATFCRHLEMQWTPPRYRQTEKIPFIPTEEEIDQLITACINRKTATLLQTLKETAIRIGEAWRLKWTDVDFERNTITMNLPEKAGRARILKISNKLKQMLQSLPKKDERIFGYVNLKNTKHSYRKLRKRIAKRLQNPRISHITFHTFRHWKATTLYHQTKDILFVKEFLGHRAIHSTLRYINIETQIFKQGADEYTTRATSSVKGARALLEVGFEYVMDIDNVKIFRKRK